MKLDGQRIVRTTAAVATVVGAVMIISGCDTPFGIRERGGVSADAKDRGVVVTNNSPSAIIEEVVGLSATPLYDPYFCTNTAHCQPLLPGESRSHSYDHIAKAEDEAAVRVSWRYVTVDAAGDIHDTGHDYVIVPLLP